MLQLEWFTRFGMTNMQVQHILITLVALCLRTAQCGEHPDGISQVSRAQDALGNYHFSYSVANNEGDQFRKEGTDGEGRVVGSYGLTHNDGTHRVVDYVADHNGFRAAVRSNEPGVAPSEAADASVVRTDHPSRPLAVAATSDAGSFGDRLKTDGSRVAYAFPEDTVDDTPSQQRVFDDYRPLSPVAYYPSDGRSAVVHRQPPTIQRPVDEHRSARVLPPTIRRPIDVPRSARVLPPTRDADTKPIDIYYPPIDPHSAFRGPSSRDTDPDRDYYSTSTSRKPFIPPYGGFDDDPLPDIKHPGVSMTTIHGGLDSRRHLPSAAPTPSYGAGRYPSDSFPDRKDFDFPRFPPMSSGFGRGSGGLLPQFPQQGLPQTPMFSPPSYGTNPNFVLRAVPIPNGIQAVKMDPETGRIYERLVYPLYLRHDDGRPAYDRNILLHNDDVGDDDSRRDDTSGYLDIPFPNRAAYRGPRDRPFDDDDDEDRRLNVSSVVDESSLSIPTDADLAWVRRQLQAVEGFDMDRVNGLSSYRGQDDNRFGSQLRMRQTPGLFDYRNEDTFSRNLRHRDGLSHEETAPVDKLEASPTNLKPVEATKSEIEKEGN